MHTYPAKLSRFESTDFASIMFDDVGCSRCHQCPWCESWRPIELYGTLLSAIVLPVNIEKQGQLKL